MEIFIEENIKTIKDLGLDKWNGKMVLFILDNGKMDIKMDLAEFGLVMVKINKVNLSKTFCFLLLQNLKFQKHYITKIY